MKKQKEISKFVNCICKQDYSNAKESLNNIVNTTIKEKMTKIIKNNK